MKAVPSTYHQCLKFAYNKVEVNIPIDTNSPCNALTKSDDTFVPHNRETSTDESSETLMKDVEKKLKITNNGMDGYKIEPVLSLISLPPSPR